MRPTIYRSFLLCILQKGIWGLNMPKIEYNTPKLKRLLKKYDESLVDKVLEEEAEKERLEKESKELKRRKNKFSKRDRKSEKYFIWGGYYTVSEISNKLNLSFSYCYRRIRDGYLCYLENYSRDSRQIKKSDELKKQGFWEDDYEKNVQESKGFLNKLLDEYEENNKYSWEDDDYEDEWESEYE